MSIETPESKLFVSKLEQDAKPKWLSMPELITYLNEVGPGAAAWCVINSNMNVVPVELEISSWVEVIKSAEIVDLEFIAKSTQPDGKVSDPFKVKASIFLPKPVARGGDVTRINYLTFGSFSRIFKSQQDRDDYLDELLWLDGMLNELATFQHGRQIDQFLRFLGTGKL